MSAFPEAVDVVAMPSSIFFDERRHLVTPRLAETVRQAGQLATGTDGRIWRYDGGVYRPDGDQWVRARVRELLGDECRRTHFEEVMVWLRSFEPTISDRPDTSTLNLANGMLDLATFELRPHDPGAYSTVQLPVAWNPEARCPRIEAFLAEVVPEDALPFIFEVIGYAAYPGNPFHKAVLLHGPGGNGKSKLLGLVRALLGPENVAAVPLQAFSENRFSGAEMFGKLANICGDLDARAIKRTDLFKQLTGGDAILAERKFGQPFTYVSYALPMFSANEVPLTSDQSDAWFRRWLPVPMERTFAATDREDPNLEAKILRRDELEGLLVRAVAGLSLLLERGRFELPPSVTRAQEAYRERLDSVRGFVGDACVFHEEAWVPRPAIYRAYRTWCGDNGREAPSSAVFYERLRRDYPSVGVATRRGQRGFRGIGLVGEATP